MDRGLHHNLTIKMVENYPPKDNGDNEDAMMLHENGRPVFVKIIHRDLAIHACPVDCMYAAIISSLLAHWSTLIIILPLQSLTIPGAANRRYLTISKVMGRGKMHSKFLLADNKNFYLGSANLDWRSLNQVIDLFDVMSLIITSFRLICILQFNCYFSETWTGSIRWELSMPWKRS